MNNTLFDKKFLDADYNNYTNGLSLAWENFKEAMPEEFKDRKKAKYSLKRFLRKLRQSGW
jgi:hypothetical protein